MWLEDVPPRLHVVLSVGYDYFFFFQFKFHRFSSKKKKKTKDLKDLIYELRTTNLTI